MLELDFCLLQSCMHAKLLQLCMTLRPMDYSLPDSSVYGDSPDKNAGVGCHALFQGIFPTQGSSQPRDQTCISCLLHWQAGSLPLVPLGKPTYHQRALNTALI